MRIKLFNTPDLTPKPKHKKKNKKKRTKKKEPHKHGYKAITSSDKPKLYEAFNKHFLCHQKIIIIIIGTLTLCLIQALLIPTTLKSYLIKSKLTKTKTFFFSFFFFYRKQKQNYYSYLIIDKVKL